MQLHEYSPELHICIWIRHRRIPGGSRQLWLICDTSIESAIWQVDLYVSGRFAASSSDFLSFVWASVKSLWLVSGCPEEVSGFPNPSKLKCVDILCWQSVARSDLQFSAALAGEGVFFCAGHQAGFLPWSTESLQMQLLCPTFFV